MAGATGLDYAVIPHLFALRQVPKGQRGELFTLIRIMERAALAAMRRDK